MSSRKPLKSVTHVQIVWLGSSYWNHNSLTPIFFRSDPVQQIKSFDRYQIALRIFSNCLILLANKISGFNLLRLFLIRTSEHQSICEQAPHIAEVEKQHNITDKIRTIISDVLHCVAQPFHTRLQESVGQEKCPIYLKLSKFENCTKYWFNFNICISVITFAIYI